MFIHIRRSNSGKRILTMGYTVDYFNAVDRPRWCGAEWQQCVMSQSAKVGSSAGQTQVQKQGCQATCVLHLTTDQSASGFASVDIGSDVVSRQPYTGQILP